MSVGRRNGKTGPMELTLTAVTASTKKTGFVTVLVYPRLKSEPPPKVTWHSRGHIAEVISEQGRDFVFLSPESGSGAKRAEFGANSVSFQGDAGAVKIRGDRAWLSLGSAGEVSLGGERLESDGGGVSKMVRFKPTN